MKYLLKMGQKGFTLLELLIVVTIVIILAAAIIPNFIGMDGGARIATTKSNLGTIRSRIVLFRANTGVYPASLAALTTGTYTDAGVQVKYLDKMPREFISSKTGSDATAASVGAGTAGWFYNSPKVTLANDTPLDSKWPSDHVGDFPCSW